MTDLAVTIDSVQESSKSELSSGTFGHFKVWPRTLISGREIFVDANFCARKYFGEKTKCVSNDRSRRDDQNAYRIIKIGAILKG